MSIRTIPTNLGLLTLSVFAAGCSDAHKVAKAFEKICEAECECPEQMELWNEVSNCKESCRGSAISLEAYIKDNVDTEPCGDLDNIIADMKRCAKNSCGESRDECLMKGYYEFYECWDIFEYTPYTPYSPLTEDPSASELVHHLLEPIPGALDPDVLHSAK